MGRLVRVHPSLRNTLFPTRLLMGPKPVPEKETVLVTQAQPLMGQLTS